MRKTTVNKVHRKNAFIRIFGITSFALLCLIGSFSMVSAMEITKIGTGHDPAISGNRVTWSGDAGSIHVYDLTAHKDTIINSSSSSNPAIYGNKLVWHDESSGIPRLTVYDIPSGAMSYITQNVDSTSFPAIYGNRIVWGSDGNVYMRDISTSTQTQIAVGESPDIYDTKVVYSAVGRDNKDIFMYDITTRKIELISPESSDLNIPHIYGNKVIWTNSRTRAGFIQMYDFVTKKAIDVTSDNTGNTIIPEGFSYADAGDDTGTHTAIYGDKIVYAKTGNDQFGNVGVYVYNISTGQSTPVITYPEYGYRTPDIYDNTVVWGSETNGNEINVCNLTITATTQSPVANFTSNVTSGSVPLIAAFTDTSTGTPNTWHWDFGDGTNSTDQNPIHTYSSSGNYTVYLTVSNGNSTDSKLATIHVSEQLPIVSFSNNLTSGYAPLSVQFMDYSILNEPNSSSPPKQQVIAEVNNCKNISLKNGETFYLRFYECPGCGLNWKFNFSPGLSVINYNCNSDTHSEESTPEGIMIRRIGGGEDCVWEIKAMTQNIQQVKSIPSEYIADTGYNFTLNITYLPQNITSGNWDFGDGTNSTEQNPTHIYFSAGNYTVKHKVTNTYGTDSKNATITVLEPIALVLPVANFSANVTSGYFPLSVQFIDLSKNAIGWNWSFGDGATSNEQSPSHIYSAGGTYTVSLIVNNANGSALQTATITLLPYSEICTGGSSSGGGGGAGGSPEPQSNVEAKELSQTFIGSGSSVKFDFPQKATPVVYLSFDSKKTTGKTTTVVEMLKGKSTLVSELPSDEVYKSLNIWVGNGGFGDSNNIENAVVNFKVEKSWIKDKNIDKSSITLNRYSDGKWNQLPTSLSGEDDKYLYFTAKTSGFSHFAITGKTTASGTTLQPATGNKTESAVNDTQNNAINITTNISQPPERIQNSNTSGKDSTKIPDFEIVSGIFCLLSVFLYKRR